MVESTTITKARKSTLDSSKGNKPSSQNEKFDSLRNTRWILELFDTKYASDINFENRKKLIEYLKLLFNPI